MKAPVYCRAMSSRTATINALQARALPLAAASRVGDFLLASLVLVLVLIITGGAG